MCIYSPMPHTLSYCALIGKCALIMSNTVLILLYTLVKAFDRFLLLGFLSLNFSFTRSGLDFLQVVDETSSLVESVELIMGTCVLISAASTSTRLAICAAFAVLTFFL